MFDAPHVAGLFPLDRHLDVLLQIFASEVLYEIVIDKIGATSASTSREYSMALQQKVEQSFRGASSWTS